MNSDKRIINVVGSMGGLKTTKSSLSWEVLKNVREEKEDSFRRREQSTLTNHRQQLLALQVAFITTTAKNPNINYFNRVQKQFQRWIPKAFVHGITSLAQVFKEYPKRFTSLSYTNCQ